MGRDGGGNANWLCQIVLLSPSRANAARPGIANSSSLSAYSAFQLVLGSSAALPSRARSSAQLANGWASQALGDSMHT